MSVYELEKLLGLLLIPAGIYYIWKKFFNEAKIPGMKPSHPTNGNLGELAEAGSLYQFLVKLHAHYGDIASFWMGQDYVVSTATPALFKQQAKLFDRPVPLYKMFEILLTRDCLMYANGTDGKRRREIYDPVYSHQAVTEDHMTPIIEISESMVDDFVKLPSEEHIELERKMCHFGLKSIFETSLGRAYRDDEQVNALKTHYDVCWGFMEETLIGVVHSAADQDKFDEHKAAMMKILHDVIDERKKVKNGTLLIDTIMSSGLPDAVVAADVLLYMIAGGYTTGLLMTWCLYYLGHYPDVQDKCYEELIRVLGTEETIAAQILNDLMYMQQVLDETLRCSTLTPYAARCSDEDMKLGDYTIPAKTAVMAATGVSFNDPNLWPKPERFDPARFTTAPTMYEFAPFGFAGKRKCPGYRLAYMEARVFLSVLLRRFKVHLAPESRKPVHKVYGLVSKPSEPIFVMLEKR